MTLPPLQCSRISATENRLDSCDASNIMLINIMLISRKIMLTTLQGIYEIILLTSKTNMPTRKRRIFPTIHAVIILIFSLWQRVWLYYHCAGLCFGVQRGSLKMCLTMLLFMQWCAQIFQHSNSFPHKFSESLNIMDKSAGTHSKQLLILNCSE